LAAARANALKLDWAGNYRPTRPRAPGATVLADLPLAELVPFIDWSPFFSTWELTGKFPAILDDDKYGPAARDLYADAQSMLQRIVAERALRASAALGFWPANAEGDDIVLFADDRRHASI